jgi:hypothetical protein
MPMALQTLRNGKVKISKANARRMVSNNQQGTVGAGLHHAYMTTLKKLGFEGKEG